MATSPTQFCSPECGHVFVSDLTFAEDGSATGKCPSCGSLMAVTTEEMAELYAENEDLFGEIDETNEACDATL